MNVLQLTVNGLPPAVAELYEQQPVLLACVPPPGATLRLAIPTLRGMLQGPFLHPGDPAWHWRWNPQGAVGIHTGLLTATLPDGEEVCEQLVLSIVPRKIDQERYAQLLEALERVAIRLAYALAGAHLGAIRQPQPGTPPDTLADLLGLLETQLPALERAVARIALAPHTTLRQRTHLVETGQSQGGAHMIVPSALIAAPTPDTPPLPAHLSESESYADADTYENRLLRRVLDELYQRTHLVVSRARSPREGTRALVERAIHAETRLRTLRQTPFLSAVGPLSAFHGPTSRLQRDPAYRTVYRCWQELRRRPTFHLASPLFSLPIHDLPHLYECWATLQVIAELLEWPGLHVENQQLFQPTNGAERGALTLTLADNCPLLTLRNATMTLTVIAQPRYQPIATSDNPTALGSLDCHVRIPDIAIVLAQPPRPPTLLVLDAKYRLEATGGLPAAALADGYVYLGSIGDRTHGSSVHAVAILYPGTGLAEHYPSQVAAVPVLPNVTQALREWLLCYNELSIGRGASRLAMAQTAQLAPEAPTEQS